MAEDHDILIEIRTKLDIFSKQQIEFQHSMVNELTDIKSRVTAIERVQDKQTGFLNGGKTIWLFISQLPAGVIALLWGINK